MSRPPDMWNAPSVAQYVRVLTALQGRITDEYLSLFQTHYNSPGRSATAQQLASSTPVSGGVVVVNALYGKLGHAACDELGIKPGFRSDNTYQWWSVWFHGYQTPGGFVWEMRPEVATALEQLGWVTPTTEVTYADEVTDAAPLIEGAVTRVTVNAYERNPEARRRCIAEHGTACCVCGFDFGAAYGPVAEGYIHVHHLRPLSEIRESYVVDPVAELRPVCPNCHAVLHLGSQCRTVDEVRQLLRKPGK